jgi:phosphoglycolate phosphatase
VAEARPVTDLGALFGRLRGHDIKVAIATMDDRAPTETTLDYLDISGLVDALVCADDGVPPKPGPEMAWHVCEATGVEPAYAVVVGDAATDIAMGRAAGVGLVVGVLSGVAPSEMLADKADIILGSVEELL